jgi:AcrR family transcriptional regulator
MFSTPQPDVTERLPRGPHRLTRDEVGTHQRERLLRAIVEHSAEHGYANTSVADIVKHARTSRAAFYEQFADREACFLAAYEELTSDLLQELVSAGTRSADYITGMREGVAALLDWLVRRPAGGRAWSLEVLSLGAPGLEAREHAITRLQRLFDTVAARARPEQAGLPTPPPIVSRAVVLASIDVASSHIRAGQLQTIREDLEGPILYLWLLGLSGHETAAAAVDLPAVS